MEAVGAVFTLGLVGAAGFALYLLMDAGYIARLNMQGRIAVMVALTVLAMVAANAINVLDIRVLCVFALGTGWMLALPWMKGERTRDGE
jgi:hypothetical protein